MRSGMSSRLTFEFTCILERSGKILLVDARVLCSGLAEPDFHARARRKKKRKGEFSDRGYLGKNFL